MYIVPDTLIYLIKNIRLDPSYQNTIYFSDAAAQQRYFQSKAYVTLDRHTYQKKTMGRIRIGMPIGSVYGTSYMMFKNTSFENKWFYAFVTNYEYVNDDTTDIFYELDLIQTYLFDYVPLECMVERMSHPETDAVGANILPESLDTGEYYYSEIADPNLLWNGAWKIVVFTTLDHLGSGQSNINGSIMGGLYSGLNYYAFDTDANGVQAVNDYLSKVSACGAESSVVAIVMIPSILMASIGPTDATYTFSIDMSGQTLGGYTPRNKKLLTSPFRGIYLTNGQGGCASYAAEYFANSSLPTFTLHFSLGAVSDCLVQPNGYRGGARQFGLELTGFPQCAYTTDGYKAWMARNSGFLTLAETELQIQSDYQTQALNLQDAGVGIQRQASNLDLSYTNKSTQNTLQGLRLQSQQMSAPGAQIGSFLGNLLKLDISGTNYAMEQNNLARQNANQGLDYARDQKEITNEGFENQTANIANQRAYANASTELGVQKLAMQKHVASLTPPQFHGQSVGSASKQFGDFGYHAGIFRIREDYAQRIDDYFDLYGYAQNRIMPPYRQTRKHWTYLKTRGAHFQNLRVPAGEMEAIEHLYDGGMRWWTDGDIIGGYNDFIPGTQTRYNADNTPLAQPIL